MSSTKAPTLWFASSFHYANRRDEARIDKGEKQAQESKKGDRVAAKQAKQDRELEEEEAEEGIMYGPGIAA